MYKTHLFGRPSIIVFSPTATKYVFRAEESFVLEWPNVEIVGRSALVAVHGKTHARLRSFVSRSINQPEALRQIAEIVQPRMISSLKSWAESGNINSYKEIKKVTFANIGMFFASFEPGPTLDALGQAFIGLISGVRSYPLNIPGFAYHHALKVFLFYIFLINVSHVCIYVMSFVTNYFFSVGKHLSPYLGKNWRKGGRTLKMEVQNL